MSKKSKKLLFVIGTRPEVIKLAPIILLACKNPSAFETVVVTTSQHREMLDQMLETFEIQVDVDLDLMRHDQNLGHFAASAMEKLYPIVHEISPDCLIVQGDTTTTFIGALAAVYNKIPIAHVEAGLRTYDNMQPFPEEVNRRLTTHIAEYHFVPTKTAQENLIREGINKEKIWITGNTCIDALFLTLNKILSSVSDVADEGRNILLTAHRRESYGEPLKQICRAVLQLINTFPDISVTYPVHLSPNVRKIVFPLLGNHPRIHLVEPLSYCEFVLAMKRAFLILTDSGGIQEEAPSLGKPVLLLRDKTERPEAVEAGAVRLVGTQEQEIIKQTSLLLTDETEYNKMSQVRNPFGQGNAAEKILKVLGAG